MAKSTEKLTDRILVWMNQQLRQGEPNHFARDVAKAMGCSVGSAAQGLHLLFCKGLVASLHVRNSANLYWLTAKGRGEAPVVGSWWRHRNGRQYQVKAIANTANKNPDHPVTVVYQGEFGHWWTRPLSDWHRSMTEVRP